MCCYSYISNIRDFNIHCIIARLLFPSSWSPALTHVLTFTASLFQLLISYYVYVQISKLSMIPVVCVMEWILHNKHYSKEVKMSVLVVVIGVGVCTVTDVKVNLKGFLCACIAVLSTSLQQIVSIKQFLSWLFWQYEIYCNFLVIYFSHVIVYFMICCNSRRMLGSTSVNFES